ncbi:dosage compensation protein dpy-30-like [Oppia nitens]|uniref:dosage compensation protein dpy-30-like n=1 Tax=Oppia nitens TaxID=1686743 RepID=UPI0023DC642A|nr:dosage compensation protein dpy-30-like [Oppia nitens]
MDETADTKPVIDPEVDSGVTHTKGDDQPKDETLTVAADKSEQSSVANEDSEANISDTPMDTESTELKTELKPVEETESQVVAPVDEPAEPAVEPVPEVALRSPSEPEKPVSPAPAVQSATPPHTQSSKKPKVDLASVPVRQYLDTTVVPILLQGLSTVARERPSKPVAYLAQFLSDRAQEYDE